MISLRRRPLILGSLLAPWLVLPDLVRAGQHPAHPLPRAGHSSTPYARLTPGMARIAQTGAARAHDLWPMRISNTGVVVGGFADISEEFGFGVYWDRDRVWWLPPLPGGLAAYATDVVDDVRVVGASALSNGAWRGVMWTNGEPTALQPLPDYQISLALGANSRGEAVGWSDNIDDLIMTGVLWRNEEPMALPPLRGDTDSMAWDINDAGQVVGQSDDEDWSRAVRWEDGEPIALGELPGHTWSVAFSISNAGQIVGWSGDAGAIVQPVLWDDDAVVALDSPGSNAMLQGQAYDINDRGDIVGFIVTDDEQDHAALWANGELTDLGTTRGMTQSLARGINDAGQVVGFWSRGDDEDTPIRAVQWTDGEMSALPSPLVITVIDPFSFDPPVVYVTPGQQVVLINNGTLEHGLEVAEWSLSTGILDVNGQGAITVPEDAIVGDTVRFACPARGHEEAGMEGVFRIVAAESSSGKAAPAWSQ